MISCITGVLTVKTLDHIEIMTPGGVGYLLQIPLSVYETLPKPGDTVSLPTSLVVKEDQWQLFGFTSPFERSIFDKLLTANGVGPALAIGLLSSLTAPRLVRAIVEHDIPTLQGVPRVGRKKAERLILDLADKLKELHNAGDAGVSRQAGANVEDAIRALVSLGYTTTDAEQAVRAALDASGGTAGSALAAPELIRVALAKIAER